MIMKFAIFSKSGHEDLVKQLSNKLIDKSFINDENNPDIVFSIGGDGTFLRAVHKYIDKLDNLKFVGINKGSLGFLYDFAIDDFDNLLSDLVKGNYLVKELPLIKGEINGNKTIYALNEIRIENPFHTLTSDVFINEDKLETFRGNGLVVASSLGSSAYNKSLGGALIDNDLCALELTEIASINNNVYRSLGSSFVIEGKKSISFKGNLNECVVGFDCLTTNDNLKEIVISYSDKKVRVIYSKDHSYVKRIRKSFVLC